MDGLYLLFFLIFLKLALPYIFLLVIIRLLLRRMNFHYVNFFSAVISIIAFSYLFEAKPSAGITISVLIAYTLIEAGHIVMALIRNKKKKVN